MSKADKVYDFDGEHLTARWDGRLCIHAQECTRATGAIFESGRKPWGQPDRVSADAAAEVVERCPTGSLTHQRKDGGAEEGADAENSVCVSNRGPLYLRGELALEGAPGDMPGLRFRAALCRCGNSKRKPFCDNAHEETGFTDRGAVGDKGPGFEQAGGPLTIQAAPNGPLLLAGSFALVNGAGRTAWRGTRAALCRCGHSANKPFCDGAHVAAGFKS